MVRNTLADWGGCFYFFLFELGFKGIISYEGVTRVTDYPIPRPALREAIFNAIVHRDYTTGIPIQIKVFPDSVIVYNDGRLPETWTVDNLLKKHRSRPFNPKIAYAFYRAGYIETWGRGIERITEACKEAGKREPLFEVTPGEVNVGVNGAKGKILSAMRLNPKISAMALAEEINVTKRSVERCIKELKEAGLVKRVGAAKNGYWEVVRED